MGSTRLGLVVVLLAVAAMACDNFLSAPPQGTLDELSLANAEGVEATLIGAYRLVGGWVPGVGGWGASASNWPFGSVPSDDAYKGSDPADQAPITDIELFNWSAGGAQSYLNDKWRSVYEGISRSNATIRLLDRVNEDKPDEIAPAAASSIEGEARFLRAHFHFEAWKIWENVPYYTDEDTDFRKSNADADPIPEILADLDAAIDLLPDEPRNGQVGRVTSWTAQAYKGRVQVYSGDYAGALTTLRAVESGGPYALEENFHRVWTGFREFANGPETILAYQASVNDGNPNGDNSNWGQRLNFPHAGSPFGCCGFHQPSQNLVNFFVVDANGLPLALSDATWNARDANLDSGATVPLDPRLDWTVGRDGVPYKDWGEHEPNWIRDRAWAGPYSPKKHVHESASNAESNVGWVPTQLNSVNIHLYRYADLLLLLAEAEVEAGDLENARAIVNRIRQRAGQVAQGPGTDVSNIAVPIDDPSITWADYEIGLYTDPWTDQAAAREAVQFERRLELAMEGHRFFDLRRWGTVQQVINDYLAEEQTRRTYLSSATPVAERHDVFPIPTIQIELSEKGGEKTLVQNPGW